MDRKYHLNFDGNRIGSVEIYRKGLYYQINCNCDLPDDNIYCLWFISGEKQMRLGVFVPNMTITVAGKVIGEGEGHFELRRKIAMEAIHYIDEDGEVFLLLNNLPRLRLGRKNGRLGVVIIQNQAQD